MRGHLTQDHLLHHLRHRCQDGHRPVAGGEVGGFALFVEWDDGCPFKPRRDHRLFEGLPDHVGHGGGDDRGQVLQDCHRDPIYPQRLRVVQAHDDRRHLPLRRGSELELSLMPLPPLLLLLPRHLLLMRAYSGPNFVDLFNVEVVDAVGQPILPGDLLAGGLIEEVRWEGRRLCPSGDRVRQVPNCFGVKPLRLQVPRVRLQLVPPNKLGSLVPKLAVGDVVLCRGGGVPPPHKGEGVGSKVEWSASLLYLNLLKGCDKI